MTYDVSDYYLKINGRGNAWPVLLERDHPFYDRHNPKDLLNASYSILKRNQKGHIENEILIDAGYGIIQELLATSNRVPEALIITHPHPDHIVSLDWLARCYMVKYRKKKKLPVYCSQNCFDRILQTFPHLEKAMEHRLLLPGRQEDCKENPDVTITGYPVYHGQTASGAMMILIEIFKRKRILITGDILFPLLRNRDLSRLQSVDYMISDASNRYPYPASNHWSIVPNDPDSLKESSYIASFRKSLDPQIIRAPHSSFAERMTMDGYFGEVIRELSPETVPLSITQFTPVILPRYLILVHYSGEDDLKHHGERILTHKEFRLWLDKTVENKTTGSEFILPAAGDEFPLT